MNTDDFERYDAERVKNATTRRRVPKKRNLTREAQCYPPNFNPTMEAVWVWLLAARGSEKSVRNWFKKARVKYEEEREEHDNTPEPLLRTTYAAVALWVKEYMKKKQQPSQEGIIDEATALLAAQVDERLNDPSRPEELEFGSESAANLTINTASSTTGASADIASATASQHAGRIQMNPIVIEAVARVLNAATAK